MIRVRIVFDVEGWAYYHRARALQEYAPVDLAIEIVPHQRRFAPGSFDLLFDLNYGHVLRTRAELSRRARDAVLLVAFNNGWPNRLDHFAAAKVHAHAVVVNNREFFERSGQLPGTYWISNGVDRRVFACRRPMADRPLRAAWIGSAYHAHTTGVKGYGDLLVPLARRLAGRAHCDFKVVDPYTANGGGGSGAGDRVLTRDELVEWYNQAAVYVVASSSEGTPNPALEAASCGCALVTTRVGNMPELVRHGVNGVLVDRTVEALEAGVVEAMERRREWSARILEDMGAWDWSVRAPLFYDLFRRLVDGRAPLLRPLGSL